MDKTITYQELENIILETDNNVKSELFNNEILNENQTNVTFEFKEFKKHNRIDCTAWMSIFPFDFKIYLDKNNIITKAPLNENKSKRIVGRQLISN